MTKSWKILDVEQNKLNAALEQKAEDDFSGLSGNWCETEITGAEINRFPAEYLEKTVNGNKTVVLKFQYFNVLRSN